MRRSGARRLRGQLLHVAANFQLISDNLLDLSHGQCLHPLFANSAGLPATEPDTAHEPETVWARFVRNNQYPNQYFQMLGFPTEQRGDHRNYMRWNPPGVLLDVGMTRAGGPSSEEISIPAAYLLTPGTATSTHNCWGMGRNCRVEEIELSATLLRVGMDVFQKEDNPFIEAQQRAMGDSADLCAMKPALLQTDRAAGRAPQSCRLVSIACRTRGQVSSRACGLTLIIVCDHIAL